MVLTGFQDILVEQWRIQGRGAGGPAPPPLVLDQIEARRAKTISFGDRTPLI